jgi:FMN-dependent oxidoreductase (nitrilotriacetate monooxygenase family)
MILSAALMHGLGHQPGAWRVRRGPSADYVSPDMYAAIARKAEEGKLHVLFLAEQITNQEVGAQRPCGAMDTAAVLSFMAAVTSRIGLVGTASSTYNQPYDLARRFATADHLSKGRVGWNCVTTAHAVAAQMFGTGSHPEAPQRYSRADEFLEVVIKLWESWDPDALVDDKTNNVFADPSKIHAINHAGENFTVRGPLPFIRSRQGRPVIFHAGSSPAGRDQAARFADVVFTAQHTTDGAKAFRADMRRRAEGHGRHPDSIKILPGMNVVLGATMDEAKRKKSALDNALTLDQLLATMARICGVSPALLREHLDRPFPIDELPPDEELKNGIGWRKSVIARTAHAGTELASAYRRHGARSRGRHGGAAGGAGRRRFHHDGRHAAGGYRRHRQPAGAGTAAAGPVPQGVRPPLSQRHARPRPIGVIPASACSHGAA